MNIPSHEMPFNLPLNRMSQLAGGLLAAVITCAAGPALAQHAHTHSGASAAPPPAPFVASTGKSFPRLMDDAMAVMDHGMHSAPMNGEPDHDFVTMMIPHHEGAVNMAKALLLYTRDPELRNLAQGIITEQQNEILLMQAWLARQPMRGPERVTPSGIPPTTSPIR